VRSTERERSDLSERARPRLSNFARRLFAEWERLSLPVRDERVVCGVSGGADSVALLLAVDELRKAGRLALGVTVAHLDHGLRGAAGEADAVWVRELARESGCECVVARADVGERAAASADNLEQAARRARYKFLGSTARACGARFVLVAHTMDDQAETVLLRLMRGSGGAGLGGMKTMRVLEENVVAQVEDVAFDEAGSAAAMPSFDSSSHPLMLARPLLRWARRVETEDYCAARQVDFRNDAMNADERFARVRVRHQLLPLMASFNPRIVEALARTSSLLRDEASALEVVAGELLKAASAEVENVDERTLDGETNNLPALRVDVLLDAPVALRRLALRRWIERGRGGLRRLELAHLEAVENLLAGERGGRTIQLPGGASVVRKRGLLYFKPY
jgi:tRNA(Ile)-lysidine synthase